MTPQETKEAAIALETMNVTFLLWLFLGGAVYALSVFVYENTDLKKRTVNWIFLVPFIAVIVGSPILAYLFAVWDCK